MHLFTVLLYSSGSSVLRTEYDKPGELFVLGRPLKENIKGTQHSTFEFTCKVDSKTFSMDHSNKLRCAAAK